MQIHKLMNCIKRINYKQVLAAVFLSVIFFISTATLPSTMTTIGNFLNAEHIDIVSAKNTIDKAYRNMLEFEGNYLTNKGAYINLNGLMARVMGQRYMNAIVKLNNGHLTALSPKKNVTLAATQLTKLYNKQKESGKYFLFVLAPTQIPKYENILPAGYTDYSNQNADNLINMLQINGVPVLDLREEMLNDGMNNTDAFFVTDHHWKPETGFWAYTKIVNYLIDKGVASSIDPMYTDINCFNVDVYKKWFLGSSGKRTGTYYAGVDDFSIITPKFETDISLEIPSKDIYREGAFADVAFSRKLASKDYFNLNEDGIYGYGNASGKIYRNEMAPINLNILSIRDSFACTSLTFLPIVVTSCEELDMRYDKNIQDSDYFQNFYAEYNPDVIIVLISARTVVQLNTVYDFFNDLHE